MKSSNNTSVFWHKIIVLFSLLFLPLFISCSSPVKEPLKNLMGHWISEDGKRQFFFSRRRLVIIDESGERLTDTEFSIGIVDIKIENKVIKRIWLYFKMDIFGKRDCWLTFSNDKKQIDTTVFGILNFADRKQRPCDC